AHSAALLEHMRRRNWAGTQTSLGNIMGSLPSYQLAKAERCSLLSLEVATLAHDDEALFRARLDCFWTLLQLGRQSEAEAIWALIDPMGRDGTRASHRPGYAEFRYSRLCFERGDLTQAQLDHTELLSRRGRGRFRVRMTLGLRGEWQLEQEQ